MKRLLFLFLIFLFVSAAYSQEFKFMGGITFSKSNGVVGGLWIPEVNPKAAFRSGALVGAGIEFSLTQNIALEVDALYFQKGCELKIWYDDSHPDYSLYTLNELSFPLLLKINLLSGTSPYLVGGGEFSFVLSHKDKGESITQGTKKIDCGLVFGFGFKKKVQHIFLFIEGRYHLGLRDLSKGERDYLIPLSKMRAFVLMAGFSFYFNKAY